MKTIFLAAFMGLGVVHAREWKSADGSKTIEAAFVGVQEGKIVLKTAGKTTAFPLTAFAADDQQFAKNAQIIAETAAKLGPQSFEFSHPVEDGSGWICRLALKTDPKAGGPKLFTGEVFFLVTKDVFAHQKGQRLENLPLFGAGGRTYHPLTGNASMVRAFALDVEPATQVWTDVMAASGGDAAKQAPNVLEPDVEIVTKHGFGVVIGRSGLIAIDPEMTKKGFKALVIHHDGKDYAATLFSPKDKDGAEVKTPGFTLVTSPVPLEPARIGTKKPLEVGQPVFAINYEFSPGRKGFSSKPAVTRGIVSRFGTHRSFQHDARLSAENPGGYVLGEKGDVFGVFFQATAGRSGTRKSGSDEPPAVTDLGTCVSTQTLSEVLEKLPGQTDLRSSTTTEDMEANGKALLAATVLVIATTEVAKPRKLAPSPAMTTAPAGTAPPPAGWSLSKSGIRHNAKCRYYNAQLPCQPTDGNPCKVCDG